MAREVGWLPAAEGCLLADFGGPPRRHRSAVERDRAARLADVVRSPILFLLGGLPTAEDPCRQPDRDCDRASGAGPGCVIAAAVGLRRSPDGRALLAPAAAGCWIGREDAGAPGRS